MVFSSLGFLYLFLPAVLILHALLPGKGKNLVLLLASLFFYYVGEQGLLLVMLASALVNYLCALGIERFRERVGLRRLFLGIALAFSLATLGYFKYADLLIGSFNLLTGLFGGAALPLLRVVLPIGISFYTFQTMSYTVDVCKARFPAEKNFIDFATYVTIFPQLIAGPIVRYETVAAELDHRTVTSVGFANGIRRFCLGLFKKVLIANTLAEFAALYATVPSHTLLFAWVCGIAQPLQIYFDFSGYSDMAIGLGFMLGFTFPENFDDPMMSRSATEFWRRWHITLGAWFRDYIYIPLGGNRRGTARQILNLLVVWAVTGLWHGASYNFILWGLFYGVLIVAEKCLYGKFLARARVLSHVYFGFITVVGFEIFCADSLPDVLHRIGELFGVGVSGISDVFTEYYVLSYAVVLVLALVLSFPIFKILGNRIRQDETGTAAATTGSVTALRVAASVLSVLVLLLSTAYLVDGSYNPFLYFRF